DMVQPSGAHAQVLREPDRGVRSKGKAGYTHPVDIVLGNAGLTQQGAQCLAQPPMCTVDRISLIGHGDRYGGHYAFITGAGRLHATGSCRFFSARVSMHIGVPGRVGASDFSSPRCTLLVMVNGNSWTKAI